MTKDFSIEGSIEHIKHVWHPSKNWNSYNKMLSEAIKNLLNCHASNYTWTAKIDDSISCRVSKINQRYGVSYKTNSRSYSYSYKDIEDSYDNKITVKVLKELLYFAPLLFSKYEDNVGYQVGIFDSFDTELGIAKGNVTEVHLSSWNKEAKIAMTLCSKISYDFYGNVHSVKQSNFPYGRLDDQLFLQIINPTLNLIQPHLIGVDTTNIKHLLFQLDFFNYEGIEKIEKYHADIISYFNYNIRGGLDDSHWSTKDHIVCLKNFLVSRKLEYIDALKTNTAKQKHLKELDDMCAVFSIDEFKRCLNKTLELCIVLRALKNEVVKLLSMYRAGNIKLQHPYIEGFVLSAENGNELSMWKFVEEKFSYHNFKIRG